MVPSRVRAVATPEAVGVRDDLADADRRITYELATSDARSISAEQWAREVWEGAPKAVRLLQSLGWRFALGLRLVPAGAPASVLGWRVAHDRPDSLTLQADSVLLTACNVVTVGESRVLWTTLVRYETPIARPIWRLAEPIHRALLPYTLARAAKALQRGASGV